MQQAEGMRDVYKIYVKKTERKRNLGKLSHKWKENKKMAS